MVFALTQAAVALTLGVWAFRASRRAWRRHHNPLDLAMSVVAGVWLLHVLATNSLNVAASTFPSVHLPTAYVAHVGYQALVVCVGFFLLTSAGLASARVYWLLVVQAVAGMAALHWQHWSASAPALSDQAWFGVNLLAATLLTLAVAYRVYLTRSFSGWLALAGCIIGLGLWFDTVMLADNVEHTVPLSHDFYFAFLLVIWHLDTRGMGPLEPRTASTLDSHYSIGFESFTGLGPARDVAASAVAIERRRIAQDLHDGVGSQIVSILAALDSHAPEQQAVVMALEQCLVDLKMTVDAIDGTNDNVIEALGGLRYRVQHSLDMLGIRMVWKVEISDELEAVRGEPAQQVLRIAQECLANVMRHANASAVKVVCRFLPETDHLLLEVRDNGKGIDRSKVGRVAGKGLQGMRRRAHAIGGELVIASKAGAGTRVRLTLPLMANGHRRFGGPIGTWLGSLLQRKPAGRVG